MRFGIQTFVNGVSLGSIYAIIALGFAIVYSVLRSFNFAHGDTYMVGVFVMLTIALSGVPIIVALLAAIAVATSIAVAVERFAYRPFRGSNPLMGVIAAVAVALVLRQVVVLIWGVQTRSFPELFQHPFRINGVIITAVQILTLAVAVAVALGVTVFLRWTRWGKAILLVRQDMEVASLMGIPVNRVIAVVYAVAGAVGAIGGYLFATSYGVIDSTFGFTQTIQAFIAAILGGIGGLGGALVGGLTLGLLDQFTAAYVSTAYENAIVFGVLVLFLLFRPYGIIGTQVKGQRV